MQYDAIVVGARCAGAPTAMLLAQRGYRVLLVDRATFPSDTISTRGITYRGLRYLQEWGLYERVLATNCPEVLRWTSHDGRFPLSGTLFKANGLAALVCPRRTVLDKLLVDAAVESGVELRENFSVRDLVIENGRVYGIQGRSGRGPLQDERGQIIVGADGKHSLVARTVQAPTYKEAPSLRCWYYAYWTNLHEQPARFRTYSYLHRTILLIPTNDNLICILIGWPYAEFDRVRTHLDQEYHSVIQTLAPEVAARMQDSERVGSYMGTADLPNFFRKPFGPGWALVGDAGYHKDPVAAHGISDSFRDADLLARAIHTGLSGEKPMQEALAEYERLRNEDAFPRYEQNCAAASFTPPSESDMQLRSALRCADQSDVDTFFSALLGTASSEAFFAPANLERILTAGRLLQ